MDQKLTKSVLFWCTTLKGIYSFFLLDMKPVLQRAVSESMRPVSQNKSVHDFLTLITLSAQPDIQRLREMKQPESHDLRQEIIRETLKRAIGNNKFIAEKSSEEKYETENEIDDDW